MADTRLRPGKLTVDLGALKRNYRLFRSMTKASVAAPVKGDAYGIGIGPVARALIEEGCNTFFVATADEAADLRAIDSKIQIAVLGGVLPGLEEDYLHHTIHPVLNSLEMIDRWSALARKKERALDAIIHFDTAMNRLGLGADETQILLNDLTRLDNLNVRVVMSHFACSDEKDHPLNAEQARRFSDIARHFPKAVKSLSNSSGLFRETAWHHDMVRPGYALYGGNPLPETENPVERVITLEIPILQIRTVKAGESVGYSASHVFTRNTTIATLALGYADGFLRSASNNARVYWNGVACPVVGRVSMDLVSIDLSSITGALPQPGEMVEVLGPHQSVDDLAARANTIGYEILTSLGPRYARAYL